MKSRNGLLDRREAAFLWALAAAGAAAFAWGLYAAPARTWGAVLIAAGMLTGLAAGALALTAILHVVGAGWHGVIRRVPEAMAGTLPLAAGAVALVLCGAHHIYHWPHAEALLHDPVLRAKSAWLNLPGMAVRSAVYLALWYAGYAWLRGLSRAQDEGAAGDPAAAAGTARAVSAGLLVVFALTFSLSSIDWLMSVEPHWFSTIFPWYQFGGAFSSALAAAAALCIVLRRRGVLSELGPAHLHDLGRLMFAFASFWAYLWFSQYLLIWYSNIPEETVFFAARSTGGWLGMMVASLALNFAGPFVVLLRADSKRREGPLLLAAGMMLAGRAVDLCVTVMPAVAPGPMRPGGVEPFILVGAGALFILAFDRVFRSAPAVPRRDPYLVESLHHV
ncbi:MAG: hypothetical protein HY928_00880 [Elusimicrobia bacterium]|nr:hypothetical protein [Elusimicrobiota bacterium]